MAELDGPTSLRVLWPHSLAAPSDAAFSLEAAMHETLSYRQAVVTAVPCSSGSTAAGWPPAGAAHELSIPVAAGSSAGDGGSALRLAVVATSAGMLLPVPLPGSQGCTEAEVVLFDPAAATPSPRPAAGPGGGLPAALASHAAGAAAGWALWSLSRGGDPLGAAEALAAIVEAQLAWFGTARPLGVKLHPPLCALLGLAGTSYTQAARLTAAATLPLAAPALAGAVSGAFALGGLGPGLSALRATLALASLPVFLPYAALTLLYRGQLLSTGLMWRVMRGVDTFPWRRRQWLAAQKRGGGGGPAPVAPRQLIGSMLLFMPLLLLLPTTAWFYAAALALHGACVAAQAAAALLEQLLLARSPLLAAWRRLRHPGEFIVGARLTPLEPPQPAGQLPAELEARLQQTVYLRHFPVHARCDAVAAEAAGRAWQACGFPAPWSVAWDILTGRLTGTGAYSRFNSETLKSALLTLRRAARLSD